jgi:hypothetical protein
MTSSDRLFSASTHVSGSCGRYTAPGNVFVLTALLVSVMAAPASAGLTLQVENVTAQAGGTGSFDVVLSALAGSFDVSGFSVELAVDPGSGVTFTGVSENTTTAAYIFTTLQSPPFSTSSFPTTDFFAADSDMTAPGYVTLSDTGTSTLGVAHVTFSVASGAPAGPTTVAIELGTNTQVLDVNANLFPVATENGIITVSGTAVPEPSSLVESSIALTLAFVVIGLRRRFATQLPQFCG